jgi:hypothetical protein
MIEAVWRFIPGPRRAAANPARIIEIYRVVHYSF